MLTRLMKRPLAPAFFALLLTMVLFPFYIATSWQSALPTSIPHSPPPPPPPAPKASVPEPEYTNTKLLSLKEAEFANHFKSVNIKRNFTHMVLANQLPRHPLRMDYHGNYSVRIVYYVNTKLNPNYPEWIVGQFGSIHRVMRPELISLHVIATSNNCKNETGAVQAVRNITANVTQNPASRMKIFLECHDDEDYDTHEYYGVKKVWDLAHQYPGHDDVLVYFHAKDITHGPHYDHNPFYSQFLFDNMDRVFEALDIFPKINKLGRYTGYQGFMFYNFWYSRGSYVSKLEKPMGPFRDFNRFYYELWLGYLDMSQSNLTPIFPKDFPDSHDKYPNTARGCYALGYEYGKSEYFNIGSWYHNGLDQHLEFS